MNKYFNILFVFLFVIKNSASINWNGNNWALGCDFYRNDLTNALTKSSDCGGRCAKTTGCTHFTWTPYNGGTCWMKKGSVSQSNAISADSSYVCGIISSGGSSGGSSGASSDCKFKFGTSYENKNIDLSVVDYITIWIGYNGVYQGQVTDMLNKAKSLNKLPVFYGYIIAFMARAKLGLQDCDVQGSNNLCQRGAEFIKNNRNAIISLYKTYAQNAASIRGRNSNIIWLIEPDFWQYSSFAPQQSVKLDGNYMRQLFDDIAGAIKSELPNAQLAWDISAWIGEQGMRNWWGFFASSSNINYLFTSGGRSQAGSSQIKPNELSWSFMRTLTGKKIIADTGYGVAGSGTGHNDAWDNINNLKARISDGVVAITQVNARSNWGSTLSNLRSNLPNVC